MALGLDTGRICDDASHALAEILLHLAVRLDVAIHGDPTVPLPISERGMHFDGKRPQQANSILSQCEAINHI